MSQTVLYLDPWSGVSGDMLLAGLLDCDRADGRLETELRRVPSALGLRDVAVEVSREVEWGIACTRVRVRDDRAVALRHLADMEKLIGGASLSDEVRRRAVQAVRRLASVEAAVHQCSVDDIHFHEVGAADTLVDVVGTFALAAALGVEKVMIGRIPVGGGTVEIEHGRMGVPAPATVRLLEGYEILGGPEMRELTTPTGALLVRELGAQQGALPTMRAHRVGYGAGTMKLEHGPNLLRVLVGTAPDEAVDSDSCVELETNLDDVSPEVIGHCVGVLRGVGALDVWTVPAYMKKDRAGVVLHVLVGVSDEDAAATALFEQTGTLGVRRRVVSRRLAARGIVSVAVAGSPVRVKWGKWEGRLVSVAPEYADAAEVSAASGVPLKDVMEAAAHAARGLLGGPEATGQALAESRPLPK